VKYQKYFCRQACQNITDTSADMPGATDFWDDICGDDRLLSTRLVPQTQRAAVIPPSHSAPI